MRERDGEGEMEREEKGKKRGEAVEKQKLVGEKLRLGVMVGKRGGPCTPPLTWKFELPSVENDDSCRVAIFKEAHGFSTAATVSARKLGANLWEVQPAHLLLPLPEMEKEGSRRRRRLHPHRFKDKHLEFATHPTNPPEKPTHQPEGESPLRRHAKAALLQQHQSIRESGHVLCQISPASYSSSTEVAPYNPEVTPTSPLDVKCKIGEASCSLKTSTDLLKLLNHIWSLEEQHASNKKSMKALKLELNHSQAQIKKLLQEKQAGRREIYALARKLSEEKVARRNERQDQIKSAVQSLQEELEDERRLRTHSESLHRKLARDLSQVKASFSIALKEHERERKARILLEELCDEFAKGVRDYEQKLRSLTNKHEKDHPSKDSSDRLVLHIAEAWLDERMQMKVAEPQRGPAEKSTIVDKLCLEIKTFLRARESDGHKRYANLSPTEQNGSCLHQHSLESLPLKAAVGAPKEVDNGEGSTDSDLQFPKLNECPCGEESEGNTRVELLQKNTEEVEALGRQSNHLQENLTRNRSLPLESQKLHPMNICREASHQQAKTVLSNTSPVLQGRSRSTLSYPDELSMKWPQGVKDNTLKAKLLEARLEAQQSRLRASRAPS